MSSEEHELLKLRIIQILKDQPWIWNDLAKILALVWKSDLIGLNQDPELLSAEGLLNDAWRKKVTDPEKIHKVFKELQLINGNQKSLTLNVMAQKTHAERILAYLKNGKTLTGIQALKKFSCYRLSSVINRLNNKPGITITCTIPEGFKHGEYKLIS